MFLCLSVIAQLGYLYSNPVEQLLENNIAKARHQTETTMATSHTEIGRIAVIRKDLDTILQDVHQAASDQEND